MSSSTMMVDSSDGGGGEGNNAMSLSPEPTSKSGVGGLLSLPLSTASTASLIPPRFTNNQRVHVKENNHMYQAVIRQTRLNPRTATSGGAACDASQWEYFVHFMGWNARHDKWAPESDVSLPSEDQPLQAISAQSARKRKADNASPTPQSSSNSSKRGKATNSSSAKSSTTSPTDCDLPLTLKTVLVEEYEKVTRRGWKSPHGYDPVDSKAPRQPARVLHNLPSCLPISKVLKHFQEANDAHEFCSNLTELFETVLPLSLLYPQERPQYDLLVKEKQQSEAEEETKKPLTKIYGCEFLLRLLVRFHPQFAAHKNNSASKHMQQLIRLLQSNKRVCFPGDYRTVKPEEYLEVEKERMKSSNDE